MTTAYGSTINVSHFEGSSEDDDEAAPGSLQSSSSSGEEDEEDEDVASITDALSTKETSPLLNNSSNGQKKKKKKKKKRDDESSTTNPTAEALKEAVHNVQSLASDYATQFQHYYAESSLHHYWTLLVFDWFTPLLYRGNAQKKLDPNDLELVPFPDHCNTHDIYETFQSHWLKAAAEAVVATANGNDENNKNKNKNPTSQPSQLLVVALWRSFGKDFLLAGLLKLIHDSCIFVGPQVLHAMIYYLRNAQAPMHQGLGLTLLVTTSQLTMSFCLRHYFFQCYLTGLQLRTAVVVAVYQKALILASGERQTRTVGEITNLMSIDAKRLQDLTTYLHAVWYTLFQITLALYFLWQQLGPSCLGGVVVMIVMMPVTKYVAQWMGRRQKAVMYAKDQRVEINSEVLSNIKILKLQAWEESFQSKIQFFRDKEVDQLWTYYVGSAASAMLWNATPVAVAVATFAVYVWSGHELEVASALTSLALFDILRFPLFMLPQIVNNLVEAGVSVHRIQSFLMCDEHESVPPGAMETNGVQMKNVTAAYESKKPRLDGVDIDAKTKDLLDTQWQVSLLKSQLDEAEQHIKQILSQSKQSTSQLKQAEQRIRTLIKQQRKLEAMQIASIEQQPSAGADDEDEWEALDESPPSGNISPPSGPEALAQSTEYTQEATSVSTVDQEEAAAAAVGGVAAADVVDVEKSSGSSGGNLLCLKRVNFECNAGDLVAVVGFVGSGKSTLINSILGEVKLLSGTSAVRGSLSYFSQAPFILNATIRDNILFGHVNDDVIDEERYQKALECCALRHDLKMLAYGDRTEIGERGVTLSGGQKARVALARAVYHNADISLIDDALSAVDAHVAKHLFHQCIVEELLNESHGKKRSVILVTNALQFLRHPRVDKIVVLNDGRVAEQGTFQELANRTNSLFARFLSVIEETGIKRTGASSEDGVAEGEEFVEEAVQDIEGDDGSSPHRESQKSAGVEQDTLVKKTMLMTEETRSIGHVGKDVYLAWAKAAGGYWAPAAILAVFGVMEGINVLSKWFLTYWSSHAKTGSQSSFLSWYSVINAVYVFVIFLAMIFTTFLGLRASQNFFTQMLDAILRAPQSFFDTTPQGRIINRFSKDMYTIDEELVMTMRTYIQCLMQVVSTLLVISGVSPIFALCLIPIILFYIKEQAFFTITYRELKRLDSVNRSPLYALLGETVDGVATIRAFSAQEALVRRMISFLDIQQHAYFLTCAAQCWLAVRLELIGTLIISFACLCAVIEHEAVNGDETQAGLFGLAISFSLNITQMLNWSVRMASDFEAHMVAVERVKDYCEVPSEADRHTDVDKTLALAQSNLSSSQAWPQGEIRFKDAKLRYRPELPLVLKGLDIQIPAGAKVGVVGRTGAGKSTLMIALLRLVELDSGKILLDGVDARTVGLATLRSKIAVIPQDPVLFSGTVRSNLDPFDQYSDDQLYEVLHRVGLYYTSSSSEIGNYSSASLSSIASQSQVQSVDDLVREGGINFSVGQRQLVVIARALLGGASIVIMDEATAAVDADTDARIQQVMKSEFSTATCITVAHRLNTIMDSDYILCMDDGLAAEFDAPQVLLKRPNGLFRDLVEASANSGVIAE